MVNAVKTEIMNNNLCVRVLLSLALFMSFSSGAVVYWNEGDVIKHDVYDEDVVIKGNVFIMSPISINALERDVHIILESSSKIMGSGELAFNTARGKTIRRESRMTTKNKALFALIYCALPKGLFNLYGKWNRFNNAPFRLSASAKAERWYDILFNAGVMTYLTYFGYTIFPRYTLSTGPGIKVVNNDGNGFNNNLIG